MVTLSSLATMDEDVDTLQVCGAVGGCGFEAVVVFGVRTAAASSSGIGPVQCNSGGQKHSGFHAPPDGGCEEHSVGLQLGAFWHSLRGLTSCLCLLVCACVSAAAAKTLVVNAYSA